MSLLMRRRLLAEQAAKILEQRAAQRAQPRTIWIVVCRTGCDVIRWLCDSCIKRVRKRMEVEIKTKLTTGFPCDECGGAP